MSWLGSAAKNFGTLLLSLILALIVWASAVVTSDPNQEGIFQSVPIEIVGQSGDLLLTNEVSNEANITLVAPASIWTQLSNDPSLVKAWIDLSGLGEGEHTVKVNSSVALNPVRLDKIDPSQVEIVLEKLTTKTFPVQLDVSGEPPFGYEKGEPLIEPGTVVASGPASAVTKINRIISALSISGASQTVNASVPVRAVDEDGVSVPGVVLSPASVKVTQPVSILGGYKNVAVKVVTTGQVANGYRLTNISVTPPTVIVFSTDPQQVNELPGFIETLPVELTGLTDDVEINAGVSLPTGITLVSDPSVLVQVGVAAIEGSMTLSLPIEADGLLPGLAAQMSPPTVDVIITGPLPVLRTLTPASFRVIVDLTGLTEGTYQVEPVLDLVPKDVQVQATIPGIIEVKITIAPTPLPPPAGTPRPTTSPSITPTPTLTP